MRRSRRSTQDYQRHTDRQENEMPNDPDFRDEVPMWVRYLTYRAGISDKYYEVRIDLGGDGLFYLTKRWGRRPDKGDGQTKVESSRSLPTLRVKANEMVVEKIGKGYSHTPRPVDADSHVARYITRHRD
jgi:predicted DNA-binding WGR domain protein